MTKYHYKICVFEMKCCVAWQPVTVVWGSNLLLNVHNYLMTETASHPRRNVPSWTPIWEPPILKYHWFRSCVKKSQIFIQKQSLEYWIQICLFITVHITERFNWRVYSVQSVSEKNRGGHGKNTVIASKLLPMHISSRNIIIMLMTLMEPW
jgi:hypothetical protein